MRNPNLAEVEATLNDISCKIEQSNGEYESDSSLKEYSKKNFFLQTMEMRMTKLL